MGLETAAVFASAALTQAGVATAVANAAYFVIANVPVFLTVGGAIAQQNRSRGGGAPPQDQGFQQTVRQAIPLQRLLIGETVTSGALFFAKSKPPYTYYGYLIAAHEVEGLQSIFINNEEVFLDTDGFATSTPFRNGDDIYIEASFRNGHIDQLIDPIIARDFADMPSTFRQRGHATLVIKRTHGFGGSVQEKNEDHVRVFGEGGQFDPLFKLRGARCYDPRVPGHMLGDPSTWQYSDNAIIGLGRAMTHKWPDMTYFNPSRLDWDKLAKGADECDRWEYDRNGKAFRRFTASAVIESGLSPYDFMEAFRIAMDGNFNLERGKIYATPGAKRKPVATFHQNMLTGGFELQNERPDDQLTNVVKTQFIAEDRNNQTVKGPVLRRADLIAADGQVFEFDHELRYVRGDPRAQRHAYYALKKRRAKRALSAGATMEARNWSVGDVIRVEFSDFLSRANGTYMITGKTPNPNLRGYQITMIEDTSERFEEAPQYETDFTLDEDTLEAVA